MTKPRTLAQVAALMKGGKVDRQAAGPKKPKTVKPTPEQMAKARYELHDIVDADRKGRVTIGKAYRRLPRFEKIDGLGTEQLKALRYYRAAFDASEMSEVKSALDVGPGGGAGGSDAALSRLEAKAFGGYRLRGIERALPGGLLATLRDVALHDLTFTEVAMKRFGSREVDYILHGRPARKPGVRSGKHRVQVRAEFFQGVALLVEVVAPYLAA